MRSTAERSKECECASAPADQTRRKGRDRYAAVDNKPFVPARCSDGSRYFDAPANEGDECTAALPGGTPEDAGELRAVESLMAGLLEENLRLKSATMPLQVRSQETATACVELRQVDVVYVETDQPNRVQSFLCLVSTFSFTLRQRQDTPSYLPRDVTCRTPCGRPLRLLCQLHIYYPTVVKEEEEKEDSLSNQRLLEGTDGLRKERQERQVLTRHKKRTPAQTPQEAYHPMPFLWR